jgi:hypothetical protein
MPLEPTGPSTAARLRDVAQPLALRLKYVRRKKKKPVKSKTPSNTQRNAAGEPETEPRRTETGNIMSKKTNCP